MVKRQDSYLDIIDTYNSFSSELPARELLIDSMRSFKSWLASAQMKNSTRQVYVSRVRQFVTYLDCFQDECLKVDSFPEVSRAFLKYVKTELQFKSSTYNNFLSTFRLYAKLSNQKLNDLEFEELVENKARRHLSQAERERYIEEALKSKTSRDLALVMLFLTTGISIGECANIRVSDVILGKKSVNSAQLRIRGRAKSRQPFEVIEDELGHSLLRWMIERQSLLAGASSDYLFFGVLGQKLSIKSIDSSLRKIGWRVHLSVSSRILTNTYKALKANCTDGAAVTIAASSLLDGKTVSDNFVSNEVFSGLQAHM